MFHIGQDASIKLVKIIVRQFMEQMLMDFATLANVEMILVCVVVPVQTILIPNGKLLRLYMT
jgi:hypothetical protein